ncbi:CaiB/BaiF CoA transferase family protein [Candidatus Poriferisocius sp.]|uniref:CaiB/BaiF CoA transferase family protein n=1 Tax=Candidatus Poriferisocius sp. TaxID=3101276 RepID=UPI003B028A5D
MRKPLAGLRVLDVGTRIAAPFCAGILGEQGAEVIKIEQPGVGDPMRTIGPFASPDEGAGEADQHPYSLFWAVEGRGRKSITLDLRQPRGQELFRELAARADVLCENFRPGTLERWNIGPPVLSRRLVTVRISVFGQQGPKSLRPGLDRNGVAYGGLLHLTGEPDRPPVRPGVTITDYLTGVFAAQAAVALLYQRDTGDTGEGGVIDAYLYGSALRILEWTHAAYHHLGLVRNRTGNRLEHSAPLDNYPSRDGRWVCIAAAIQANFDRLCTAMNRRDLLDDPRFATAGARAANGNEINAIVAGWTSQLDAGDIEARCVACDVPVATAYDAADIAADPHMIARSDLIQIDDPVIGPLRQQAPFPRFDHHPPPVPAGAPRLGQHTDEVLTTLCNLTATDLAELRAANII